MLPNEQPTQNKSFPEKTLDIILSNLEPIKGLLADPAVDEIQINTPDEIYARRSGRDELTGIKLDKSRLNAVFVATASYNDKIVAGSTTKSQEERQNKKLSAKLPGLRLEGVMPPIAVRGMALTIRKHNSRILTLEDYIESRVITNKQAEQLKKIAQSGETFIVAGATYSGKTTLLNTMLQMLPDWKRLFVIEQVSELKIAVPNHVLIECDPTQGMTAKDALNVAMRFSPHAIVMGELRGPEAITFLEAANTGHHGATTIHSQNAKDTLTRLEDLCMQAERDMPLESLKARIAAAVKWVIYVSYTREGRKLDEIVKINGLTEDRKTYLMEDYTNE